MDEETLKRLQAFAPVCVYQDFSRNAARKLSSKLEYVRELLDNTLAPGPERNAPPGGGPLRVQVSLADQPIDESLTYKVLTYRENGASVGVGSLDNLVNYGHKKTLEVLAEGASPFHTPAKPEAGDSSSTPPAAALSVYGEIGQGLPMSINALAARAYLFYNHCGQTHVVTYGQAIHDKDGAVCRGVLLLPNKEPSQTRMPDLLHVVKDNKDYRAQAAALLGHYVREYWLEDEHGPTVPLYGTIQELMERAKQVPTPGLLYDFVLMKGTSLKSSLNPRTKALDIEDTEAEGSLHFLSEAVRHWYLPGENQGCELGRHIQPPPPALGVILSVQGTVVDRFSEEPWVRQRRAPGTSATQVLTMVHPVLGDIRIQILFWPRPRDHWNSQVGQPTDDDALVDDAAIGGIRLFQSSDRAVWTNTGHVPHCLNTARCSLSWHVARSGGNRAADYKHFLEMCGLRDEAAAEAAGLPSKKDFADIKGGKEKDVKYWLTLNNMMCYVMVERSRLHDLGLLKETKDDLKDTKVSRELYHVVYRGIAKRIWEERDRMRAAAVAAPSAKAPAAAAAATPQDRQQRASRSAGTSAQHAAGSGTLCAAVPQVDPGPSSGRSPPPTPHPGPAREVQALALGSTPVFESASRKRKQPERFSFVTPQRAAPRKPTAATRQKARQGRDSGAGDIAAGSSVARADQVLELLESVLETASQLKQAIGGKSAARSYARHLERALELAKLSQEVVECMRGGQE